MVHRTLKEETIQKLRDALADQTVQFMGSQFFASDARPSASEDVTMPPARYPDMPTDDPWNNPTLSRNCVWDYQGIVLFQTYIAPHREMFHDVAIWRLYHLDGIFYLSRPKGSSQKRTVGKCLGRYSRADHELCKMTRKYVPLANRLTYRWTELFNTANVVKWSYGDRAVGRVADVSAVVPTGHFSSTPVHYRVTQTRSGVEWDEVMRPPDSAIVIDDPIVLPRYTFNAVDWGTPDGDATRYYKTVPPTNG